MSLPPRQSGAEAPAAPAAVRIERPPHGAGRLVYASPHAGRHYPPDLCARLEVSLLRRLEDAHVDALLEGAAAGGAVVVQGLYGRAYVDLNRDPQELDPAMFAEPLPPEARIRTARVAAGLGVIPRYVAGGREIYGRKLGLDEVQARIATVHAPYHRALAEALDAALDGARAAILVDWHSMPSAAAAPGLLDDAVPPGRRLPDVVLGDRHGAACAPALTDWMERRLTDAGLRVARNHPYAGGYTTQTHGRPQQGVHTLQVELSRALYLDETRLVPGPGLPRLRRLITRVTAELAAAADTLVATPTDELAD
jgi:N-formylglutamate amidohydrolase